MRFISEREFNGVTWYGYQFGDDPLTYWSMRIYPNTGYVQNMRRYGGR